MAQEKLTKKDLIREASSHPKREFLMVGFQRSAIPTILKTALAGRKKLLKAG